MGRFSLLPLSLLLACFATRREPPQVHLPGAESVITLEARLEPGWKLEYLRFALDHEVLYLNARPADHPPPRRLTSLPLSVADHTLHLELRLRSTDGRRIVLQRAGVLRTDRHGSRVRLVLAGSAPQLRIVVDRGTLRQTRLPPSPSCTELNASPTTCDGESVHRAVCRMTQLERRARGRSSPGWEACVRQTRLRLNRMTQTAAQEATRDPARAEVVGRTLSRQADALRTEAIRCVESYFLCTGDE